MTLRSPGPATRRGEMLLLGVAAGSAGWELVRSWVGVGYTKWTCQADGSS